MKLKALLPTMAALALLTACTESAPLSDLRAEGDEEPEPELPFEPTLQAIQENVFTPICTECHAGNIPSGGLALDDEQTSYDSLVDVDARGDRDLKRVLPGDPDNSYLIHKLEGTQSSGSQMPRGQPPLDEETIAVIRKWITDGALREPPPEEEEPAG